MLLFQTMKTKLASEQPVAVAKLAESDYRVQSGTLTGKGVEITAMHAYAPLKVKDENGQGFSATRTYAIMDKDNGAVSLLFKKPGNDYYSTSSTIALQDDSFISIKKAGEDSYRYGGSNYATGESIEFAYTGKNIKGPIKVMLNGGSTDQTKSVLVLFDKESNEVRFLYKVPGQDYYSEVKSIEFVDAPTTGIKGAQKSSMNLGVFPGMNSTKVNLELEKASQVTISVVNMAGKVVSETSRKLGAGEQTIDINTSGLKPGIYIFNVNAGENGMESKKAVLR